MKKFAILSATAASLALAGCWGGDDPEDDPAVDEASDDTGDEVVDEVEVIEDDGTDDMSDEGVEPQVDPAPEMPEKPKYNGDGMTAADKAQIESTEDYAAKIEARAAEAAKAAEAAQESADKAQDASEDILGEIEKMEKN